MNAPERFVPRLFQERFEEHAHRNPYSAIWADMGAGKTATVLSLITRLFRELDVARVLVVAPKRVASNVWPAEIARWEQFQGLSCRVLTAEDFAQKRTPVTITRKGEKLTLLRNLPSVDKKSFLTGEQIHTISRDLFSTLVRFLGKRYWPYDMVVLDEAQGFRNWESGRFRAARVLRKHGMIGRLVQLAGTPRPKSLEDLLAQLYLLDLGARLGSTLKAYRDEYFDPGRHIAGGKVVNWDPKPGAEARIFDKVKDLCVSLLPEDAVQLPPRTINPVFVELPPGARAQYDRLEQDSLLQLRTADVAAVNRGVLVGKLLQVAGGAVFDDEGEVQRLHEAKLDALEEIVESHPGTPLLIACWYQHERDRIKERFPDVVELDDYPDTEERWNRGEIDKLMLHPAKGAHGLNLQGNDGHGVWFGPIHDLELWLQWNKRLHRPGRVMPVFIHVLLARDTIDAATLRGLAIKERDQDRLLKATRIDLSEGPPGAEGEKPTELIDEIIRLRREELST
jgi:SNF2 family DNA or RNA helicase